MDLINRQINKINLEYLDKGFCVFKLNNFIKLQKIKRLLLNKLRILINKKSITLENYHKYVVESQHEKIQWELCNYFRKKNFCYIIAHEQLNIFRQLVGVDLLIQKDPFLRISRPNKEKDNIGYHRDTVYGQSPFEVSVLIPLVNLNANSCLKFLPKSHVSSDKRFKFDSINTDIKKGSKKHNLGYPYSPKIPKVMEKKMFAPNVKFGNAIIFSPSIVHGQRVNTSTRTRFSFDFRIMNMFSPVKLKNGTSRDYKQLVQSSISKVASIYFHNNK